MSLSSALVHLLMLLYLRQSIFNRLVLFCLSFNILVHFRPDRGKTPASLDFILSSHEEPTRTLTVDLIVDECSKICQGIWQLQSYHKSVSVKTRENMIDDLSTNANQLYNIIRSPGTSKNKRRASSPLKKYDDDEDEEEEEDYDDDDGEEGTHESIINPSFKFKNHAEYELIRQARNLQDAKESPKYRRRNRRSMVGQKCHSCSTTETPEWRKGPDGARTLCNACGLHYSKLLRKGSIGVQTQNYLLTGGIKPQTPSIVSASAISDNSKNMQSSAMSNFPFVLMDPKYGLGRSIQQTPPNYTPSSATDITSPLTQPPPPNQSSHHYTLSPLRIHQWKQ
ncbi:uncharacterized protein EV154DRAFT_489479 [Mucor mucedo]|uniref:uncharacterized protein n=1 Tax=Mucor mucedo TaxID=29922 RepID=UPI0022207622|nr:uncharacterized protein EV154DRAFT_489479 [Mucor mucedo]KAI7897257.1 hypothetical protein EV154DRAFT_489479 [Mucor mucedo]